MKLSLGYQVLLATLLGLGAGLFFGPLTESLTPIGAAYTMLLQMAVLPYITFSLIHGIGSTTPQLTARIFKASWPFFASIWAAVFFLIYLLSSLIPNTLSPIVRSTSSSAIESEFSPDFLVNLIPQNPFYDLLNNVVPAIAIFGLIAGFALMHIPAKEPLLSVLERLNQTFEKILDWLGKLSPLAAFVYISVAFGTLHFEDLYKVELYVLSFLFCTLFITFCLLPAVLSTLTPLSFKEALSAIRSVCLLPFVTGLSTTAIPFLNLYLKQLSRAPKMQEQFHENSQTILPIAYSFGHVGNAMSFFFLLFLSYYYRHPFSSLEKGLLALFTIPLSIGSSTGNIGSIYFLIQQLGFPDGALRFYSEIKAFTFHFQVLMSIASVLTLILLTLYAYYGLVRWKWRALSWQLGPPLLAFILIVFITKTQFRPTDRFQNLYLNLKLSDVLDKPVPAEILEPAQPGAVRSFSNPLLPEIFRQIITTRTLKVGFYSDSIPYCYYNNDKELVGYDITYAYELARDLGCKLQFIPFQIGHLADELNSGAFDIAMSSIIMDEERLLQMQFTFPYFEDYNVLVVPREKKGEFLSLQAVQERSGLKIAGPGALKEVVQRNFPNATVLGTATTASLIQGECDALMWSEITAVIWCLSHPDYVVIDYSNELGNSYYAYPIQQHATDFGFFLNSWLRLKEHSGFKKEMEDYWLQGIIPEKRHPRWSILRNVLHWQDDP